METDVVMSATNASPDYGSLSNFDIEKKIGKGQFSEVFRAVCKSNGQVVALKKVQVNQWQECNC